MQEIWMAGLDWDDVLPSNLRMKWETWVSELQDLSHVAIPRCLRLPNSESVDLHLFSDVSKDAVNVLCLTFESSDNPPPRTNGCHSVKSSGKHNFC